MMIKTILMVAMMALNNGYSVDTETVVCSVESLDKHGYVQFGEDPEYVCVNVKDNNDLIVVVDEYDEIRQGDIMELELNMYGEIVDYEVIWMNE